jgi:hypothetical protein
MQHLERRVSIDIELVMKMAAKKRTWHQWFERRAAVLDLE